MPVAAVVLAMAVVLVPGGLARTRLAALLRPAQPDRAERLAGGAPLLVSALLGASAALGVGGLPGAVCGLTLAVGGYALMRRLSGAPNEPVDRLGTAGTFDLLAACLGSGLPVATAALIVAPSAPPRVAAVLRQAGDLLTFGAEPAAAWRAAAAEPATEALARIARRSARSGASLSAGVAELAAHQRGTAEDSRGRRRAGWSAGCRTAGAVLSARLRVPGRGARSPRAGGPTVARRNHLTRPLWNVQSGLKGRRHHGEDQR